MRPRQASRTLLGAAALGFAALASVGCAPVWTLEHVAVEAIQVEEMEDQQQWSDSIEFEERSFRLKATMTDPNAEPPKLAIVHSLGRRWGTSDDCTGFFIDKTVFLTAGHCIKKADPNPKIILPSGRRTTASCSVFPSTLPKPSWQDWAVCSLPPGAEVTEGTLGLTSCVPAPNTQAVMMGFCEAGGNGSLGIAAAPNAGVVEVKSPTAGFIPGSPLSGRRTFGCLGDSGGPAFLPATLTPRGNRFLVGAPVRVFGLISWPGPACGGADRTCLAPTTDADFLAFLKAKTGISVPPCT